MKARRRFLIGSLPVLFALASGCYVPDYHTPKGFSSTYHRRLLESERAVSRDSFWRISKQPAAPIETPVGVEGLAQP